MMLTVLEGLTHTSIDDVGQTPNLAKLAPENGQVPFERNNHAVITATVIGHNAQDLLEQGQYAVELE